MNNEVQRINVRCCCQPTKILGTLPAPPVLRRGAWRTFAQEGGGSVTLPVEVLNSYPVKALFMDYQETERLVKRELAYKSEDTPIEELRKIPQFEECV